MESQREIFLIEILRILEVIMQALDILLDEHCLHMQQQVLYLPMFYNHKQEIGTQRIVEETIELWDISLVIQKQILFGMYKK